MIIEISKNPVLYDKTDKNYKDMKKRRDIYHKIGEKIGLLAYKYKRMTSSNSASSSAIFKKAVSKFKPKIHTKIIKRKCKKLRTRRQLRMR